MKIKKTDEGIIDDSCLVQVTHMNHLVEVRWMRTCNNEMPIKKIDKDSYEILATGEIKEFAKISNRGEFTEGLRRTFKSLRYLINNNFVGNSNELHVTLTYAENMTDTKRLYNDFKVFMILLRRKYKGISTIDVINVVEPQERGAWHCHVLLRFNDIDSIFIKNEEMRELWKHGYVTVRSLNEVDNIGAYLSAYLTDVELTETTCSILKSGDSVMTKMVDGKEKKFIKGGRLHMYPPGMNLYRCSRGIKKPTKEFMLQEDIKKVVKNAAPHYSQTIIISDDDKVLNTIVYNQYNLKRQNLQ